uniref:Uncharacterized protein n=1 Tax=Timema bartmani TaxID=61472 RepID=A0A7R9HWJ1_9NEOP|nr:unnamed protein product [Timema bartmani]
MSKIESFDSYLQYKEENNDRDNMRRKSESKDSPEKERCEPIPKPKAKTPSKPDKMKISAINFLMTTHTI